MGYANDGMPGGSSWKTVCSQFIKIGSNDGADMTLKDLVPGGTWAHGSDQIKVIADTSAVKFKAVYIWKAQCSKRTQQQYPELHDGWYKLTTDVQYDQCVDDEPLPFGTAVLATASTTTAYLTSSGEVVKGVDDGRIGFSFDGKWRMIGNATPVLLHLSDFKPNDAWVHASDQIKVISETSAVKFKAVYIWKAQCSKRTQQQYPDLHDGWYKLTTDVQYGECVDDEPIPAGSGILAQAASSDAVISIPAAL